MIVSTNDQVRVRLTEEGKARLWAYMLKTFGRAKACDLSEEDVNYNTDHDNPRTFQIHSLMEVFGVPTPYVVNDHPFVDCKMELLK